MATEKTEHHALGGKILKLINATIDARFGRIMVGDKIKASAIMGWVDASNLPPHAESHQEGGEDEVGTLTPAPFAIPYADEDGLLDAWVSLADYMLKETYDANDNGIVDAAESVPWTGITNPLVLDPREDDLDPTSVPDGTIYLKQGEIVEEAGNLQLGAGWGWGWDDPDPDPYLRVVYNGELYTTIRLEKVS